MVRRKLFKTVRERTADANRKYRRRAKSKRRSIKIGEHGYLVPKRRGSKKRRASKSKRWMQKATRGMKKGTLHRMLGIPLHKKIPTSVLRRALRQAQQFSHDTTARHFGHSRAYWKKLRARAQMALNFRKKSK